MNSFEGKLRHRKLAGILNNTFSTDMYKFEIEEIAKNTPLSKNIWNDWVINYIQEPIKR